MPAKKSHYIDNQWIRGAGPSFASYNPVNEEVLWLGNQATPDEVDQAILAAKQAFPEWAQIKLSQRIEYLNRYHTALKEREEVLAEIISKEIGKPLWEAKTEVTAMIHKIPLSIQAYHERCKIYSATTPAGRSKVHHKPHGVVAVFGPFNFPGHVPNGHIVPALLAGNTLVFKPSEQAPLIAEAMMTCWEEANLPRGVLNLVQGASETGKALSQHRDLQGLFFTGSYKVGSLLAAQFGRTPEKILALELGGNNPLVVHDISEAQISAAVYHTLQAAYITAGQRCTSARRLILTKSTTTLKFVEQLISATKNLKVGPYWEEPQPFLGPVISKRAADQIMDRYEKLLQNGGKSLVDLKRDKHYPSLLRPGLIDVSSITAPEDEEIFGPVLQLIWVNSLEEAIRQANNTAYGLAAALFCEKERDFQTFLSEVKAGLINWNRTTTGALGHLPFGGVGRSGNHRPSGFYAADYCAYPVASIEQAVLELPSEFLPGITL